MHKPSRHFWILLGFGKKIIYKNVTVIMTTTRERQLKEFEEWVTAEGLIKPNGLTIAKTEEGGYGLVFESTEKLKEFQQVTIILITLKIVS
jgi:hypothetical protein